MAEFLQLYTNRKGNRDSVCMEEANESGVFVRSWLATSAGRVLQRLMESQCARQEFLQAESAAP